MYPILLLLSYINRDLNSFDILVYYPSKSCKKLELTHVFFYKILSKINEFAGEFGYS